MELDGRKIVFHTVDLITKLAVPLQLFRDGKITGTKAALYKSKYAELHELLKRYFPNILLSCIAGSTAEYIPDPLVLCCHVNETFTIHPGGCFVSVQFFTVSASVSFQHQGK